MYTYQLDINEEMQAAGITDFREDVEQAEFHSRLLVYIEVAIHPLLLKLTDSSSR